MGASKFGSDCKLRHTHHMAMFMSSADHVQPSCTSAMGKLHTGRDAECASVVVVVVVHQIPMDHAARVGKHVALTYAGSDKRRSKLA